MKRSICVALVFVILCSMSFVVYSDTPDIPSPWARQTIIDLKFNGFLMEWQMKDYHANITRFEMAYKTLGICSSLNQTGKYIEEITKVYPNLTFTDTSNDWNVETAGRLGIVSGIGKNKYGPDMLATREEVIASMINAIKKAGVKLNTASTKNIKIADENQINKKYIENIKAAIQYGIVTLGADKKFNPKGYVSNESMYVMIYRIMTNNDFRKENNKFVYGIRDWFPTYEKHIRPYIICSTVYNEGGTFGIHANGDGRYDIHEIHADNSVPSKFTSKRIEGLFVYGNKIYVLAHDDNNICRLYSTNRDGSNAYQMLTDEVYTFAIDPRTSTFYVATSDGIFKCNEFGDNKEKVCEYVTHNMEFYNNKLYFVKDEYASELAGETVYNGKLNVMDLDTNTVSVLVDKILTYFYMGSSHIYYNNVERNNKLDAMVNGYPDAIAEYDFRVGRFSFDEISSSIHRILYYVDLDATVKTADGKEMPVLSRASLEWYIIDKVHMTNYPVVDVRYEPNTVGITEHNNGQLMYHTINPYQ